ncbi:MAG: sensor histidine kinase [Bacteroidetes bacterium]|nr:sensor histidine kinase [Bacteroidota bacterium]
MKYSNLNKIALNLSLLIVLFFGLVYFVASHLVKIEIGFLPFILSEILLFFFSYFLYKYTINKFIYEKIKLIYKTIHNLKAPKTQQNKIENSSDIISNVNQQVLSWAQDKKEEIDQLKKLERYRKEFLGNVSHELKTPIFNIQGYVLTLLDGGLDDITINREYLLRTEKSINRMIAIVEDLEAISLIESGELIMKFHKFDIIGLVQEVFEFLEIKASKKQIRLSIVNNSEKPIYVFAEKERIRQVLINLIDNSIKYGREKGKTKVSFFDMDENMLIEVTDDGFGISQEDLPRLFERFYRADKSRSREQGGSGLGLAIVKHLIEAHNQTINVRSTIGIGSTFAFTLKKIK